MPKKYFLLKLIAPRPTFPADMNEAERAIMQHHAEYWSAQRDAGTAIVVGPVMDPKGVWGLGVVEVDGAEQLQELIDNDPAAKARIALTWR